MPVMLPRNQPRKALPASSAMHKKNIPEKLQKIMETLRNRDGFYNKSELKNALKELGAYFPGWRAHRAFGKADDNNDGLISGEEIDTLLEYLTSCGFGK